MRNGVRMDWLVYASATAVALATADVLIKLTAGKLSNSVALLLYGCCTFLAGVSWVLWERSQGGTLYAQPSGIVTGLGVGIAFSCVTVGLYATFGAGVPVSIGSPVIRLTGLLLASLAGILFLQEPVTWRYALGMLLVWGGIYLILTR